MSVPYKAFPIKEFVTGIDDYLQPWQRPIDSFEPLVNAYINRGAINKRAGYTPFGTQLQTATSGTIALTDGAGNLLTGLPTGTTVVPGSLILVGSVDDTTYTDPGSDGVLVATGGTGTGGTVVYSTGVITIASGGSENLVGTYSYFGGYPVMGIMRYINESTGDTSLLVATTVSLYIYNTGTYVPVGTPPTFTGNITNFFNYCNWQDTVGASSLIYMTNNNDPIETFDGTNGAVFTPTIDGSGTTITNCLDVQVYNQRLLYIRPTLSSGGVQNQSIYWSAVTNSSLNRTDIAGQGGFLAAPTGDIIVSAEFLKDILIVFFSNSTWIFRFTGNQSDPFRWVKINNSKSTTAPYASVPFDQVVTSVGSTGLIAADGTSVERYDIKIIDYYEDNFSAQYYAQSFSQRYDNLNQSWILYVSNDSANPLVGGVAPGSDSALIYNFIEKSWATYTFPVPMTCMGLFYAQTGADWASLTKSWESADQAWNTYSSQKGAFILLMGDVNGNVYQMDNESSVTDNGVSIVPDIVSTRWNPLIDLGTQTQFGYIDIYYYIASVDSSSPVQVTLNFYINNSEQPVLSRPLTLDGPVNSEYTFKRIYINLIGQFLQMEIDPSVNSFMQFIGFILWARPAGRLTF